MPVTGLLAGARGYGMFGAVAPSTAFDSIATATPSGVNRVTFSNIPQNYASLQLRIFARTTLADTFEDMNLVLGSDYTQDYGTQLIEASGSAIRYLGSETTGQVRPGFAVSANSLSNAFSATIVELPDYSSTTRLKMVRVFNGSDTNGSGFIIVHNAQRRSTSAVTTLFLEVGSGTFVAGTSVALYGIRGAA